MGKVKLIETFDEWDSEVTHFIEFKRPDGRVDRFLCKGLTGEDLDEIEKECKTPLPPNRPKMGPGNQPVVEGGMATSEPDYKDPGYLAAQKEMEIKKVIMILEKGMLKPPGKDIPGKDYKEKYAYLNKKLRGDVFKLANFIQMKLSNLQPADVGFFG